jgi:Fructose-1,6-bisphosphatase
MRHSFDGPDMKPISLIQFLIEERRAGHINAELSLLIEVVARACKRIAVATNKGRSAACWAWPAPTMR